MRISTSSLYNDNVATMNTLQTQIGQTQQQISTGRRLLNAADDPAAAARAAELTQTDMANDQLASNRIAAINTLSLSESILQGVTSLLQDAKDVAVEASSGTMSGVSRKGLAADLQGKLDVLMGLANSTDGLGNYLFSGGQGGVQPFVSDAGGVAYKGDDVQRKVQASASRQITTTDTGSDIFMRIRNGNGTFQAAPAATNGGSGIISQGGVTDPSQYTGQSYQLTFSMPAATYTVNDVTAGAPGTLVTTAPYVSGQSISFNGIQFEVQGTPANGDVFNISPSTNQSVFETLGNLISALNTGAVSGVTTAYNQSLKDANASLSQSLGNVLGVRATMGARLNELDALQSSGEDIGLQYKQTLSKIQDTDYNKAITDLTMQQMMLQASQQSFVKVSQMSLFNYL
ncbi:MAG: flagellar hook-associated protein FlgL [Gammaproteobacteria bacterium]|nr:flagellar hook-associated protein 3 [Sideroxydans sp.]MBU3904336.1 flagellar hook-associated protein FlgL [Gammaproteobacteria bacterium]MBU4046135.1 flagellar hook-associated protein FlgL [Gammaproteobacteria bacterium]MBU4150891.1 flagellar hook-associated protein FlgL [Gammaproteobacteria bacterium]